MNLSAAFQHLAIFFQEIPVGQPALFLVALGPGIAEINVQAIHLARGEQLRQQGGVRIDEEHIFQPLTDDPLHGHHHGVRHLLHGNEQRVRQGLRRSGGEATLAAAQLHLQPLRLGIQLPPMAPHGLRLADPAALAGVHARVQILLFSHTHLGILLALAPAARGDFCDIIPQNTALCKRIISFSPEKTGGNGRRWRNALKSVQRLPLCFVRYVKFKKDGRETLDKN